MQSVDDRCWGIKPADETENLIRVAYPSVDYLEFVKRINPCKFGSWGDMESTEPNILKTSFITAFFSLGELFIIHDALENIRDPELAWRRENITPMGVTAKTAKTLVTWVDESSDYDSFEFMPEDFLYED